MPQIWLQNELYKQVKTLVNNPKTRYTRVSEFVTNAVEMMIYINRLKIVTGTMKMEIQIQGDKPQK